MVGEGIFFCKHDRSVTLKTWSDPYRHFAAWFAEAQQVEDLDAHAMVLATAARDARPSSRVVHFKGVVDAAFSFYTNYNSRKGQELATNHHAALLFYWQPLDRQVRVEGTVRKLSREQSEQYFASRPWLHQLSSRLSQQSTEIASYRELRTAFIEAQQQYAGQPSLPCPANWGGYALMPQHCEFYIADEHRLSERVLYVRGTDDSWQIKYLSP